MVTGVTEEEAIIGTVAAVGTGVAEKMAGGEEMKEEEEVEDMAEVVVAEEGMEETEEVLHDRRNSDSHQQVRSNLKAEVMMFDFIVGVYVLESL